MFVTLSQLHPSLTFSGMAEGLSLQRISMFDKVKLTIRDKYSSLFQRTNKFLMTAIDYLPQNRLEKLVRDKHSSLLQKLVKHGQKSFITLGPEPNVI